MTKISLGEIKLSTVYDPAKDYPFTPHDLSSIDVWDSSIDVRFERPFIIRKLGEPFPFTTPSPFDIPPPVTTER